jgi:hypothetical protein
MLLVGLACLLSAAESALAWGPATHVGLGVSILDELALLPPAIAALLGRHAIAYLYGSIAADVVFAKRLSRVKQFCHHWSTAFKLLDGADDDHSKAFAYGYLSHLAADTVAHGKYVPRQIVVSDCTVNFGHMYWELRANSVESEQTWQHLQRVLLADHTRHHQALSSHIKDTFLTYDLNRILFDGMNALTVHQGFRQAVTVWGRCSRWYLSPALLDGYRTECLDRIHAILTEGSESALLREDPNGTSALMHLRIRRREMRRRKRRGHSFQPRIREASTAWAPSPGHRLSHDRPPDIWAPVGSETEARCPAVPLQG